MIGEIAFKDLRWISAWAASQALSCRNRYRELIGDRYVDVDVCTGRPNRNQQCVARGAVSALQSRLFLPPAAHRKDANGVTLGEQERIASCISSMC